MKTKSLVRFIPKCLTISFIFLTIISIKISNEIDLPLLQSNMSLYYEEKYFRFLANNYETIDQGTTWSIFSEDNGIGFKAKKDFGSAILLKDWSMYNFKLTKIVFRPYCTVIVEKEDGYKDDNCAEMWLYHEKDNSYYPPGRRIYIKENYLVLIVQFKKTDNNNPANDLLFDFLNLNKFGNEIINRNSGIIKEISPKQSIKLHQIIQNQPSYLFEGMQGDKSPDMLFMVFSKYHFISETNYQLLNSIFEKVYPSKEHIQIQQKSKTGLNSYKSFDYYRNTINLKEIAPEVTLMSYNSAHYLIKRLFFYWAILSLFMF